MERARVIIVTTACEFIGNHLVDKLVFLGYNTRVVVNLSAKVIEEIKLIVAEYFDKDFLAIFSSYNNKDIELYNNFIKRKNNTSKAAYIG